MFKLNDRVFDYTLQEWGTVTNIDKYSRYPCEVTMDNTEKIRSYTSEGCYYSEYKAPTLFFNEVPPVTPPKRPPPKLRLNIKVLVWEDGCVKVKRYFSHFSSSGTMQCFPNGTTSWSSPNSDTSSWSNWKVVEER